MALLILGTKSRRRIDLFSKFKIPFKTIHSDFDESTVPLDLPPQKYVKELAEQKGRALEKIFPDLPILTADTTVFHQGTFINKPADQTEAFSILSRLQNDVHEVWTGMSLISEGKVYSIEEKTSVYFHPLTPLQINQYIKAFNPLDKAGSYAIQDGASILVKKIEGDFYNVVGFPIASVQHLLHNIGIDLWHYLGP